MIKYGMDEKNPPTPLNPPPQTHQLVQFEGFRCMAYLDAFGKWRAFFGGKELTGFLHIVAE